MRLSQSHDPTYRYMIFNLDSYRFFCLFFTPIYFFNFMDLLKIKLLYFFCFAFYDNNFASRSKSHVCHASLDWLEAFTLFYFIFMSNLFLIVLIFYPFLKLIFFKFSTFNIWLFMIGLYYFFRCGHPCFMTWVTSMRCWLRLISIFYFNLFSHLFYSWFHSSMLSLLKTDFFNFFYMLYMRMSQHYN